MIPQSYEVDLRLFLENVIIRHKQEGQSIAQPLDLIMKRAYIEGVSIMALKRNKSNIVNLGLVISNEDGKAGMTIDQTILNGKSATVSFRLINGAKKSGAVKLDRQSCEDLFEALKEILATESH